MIHIHITCMMQETAWYCTLEKLPRVLFRNGTSPLSLVRTRLHECDVLSVATVPGIPSKHNLAIGGLGVVLFQLEDSV